MVFVEKKPLSDTYQNTYHPLRKLNEENRVYFLNAFYLLKKMYMFNGINIICTINIISSDNLSNSSSFLLFATSHKVDFG